MPGFIYLVHEREFIRSKEHIFKIGQCLNPTKRLRGYPKGSLMLFEMIVEDHISTEKELIKILSDNFKRRYDMGLEYFEGELMLMIKLITEHILAKYAKYFIPDAAEICIKDAKKTVTVKKEIVKKVKVKKDITLVLEEFLNDKKETYRGDVMLSEWYEQFSDWMKGKEYHESWNLSKILRILKKHYKLQVRDTFYDTNLKKVICFPHIAEKEDISQWLYDHYEKDDSTREPIQDVYKNYLSSSTTKMTHRCFGICMRELGYKSRTNNGVRYYNGIKLKDVLLGCTTPNPFPAIVT